MPSDEELKQTFDLLIHLQDSQTADMTFHASAKFDLLIHLQDSQTKLLKQ